MGTFHQKHAVYTQGILKQTEQKLNEESKHANPCCVSGTILAHVHTKLKKTDACFEA